MEQLLQQFEKPIIDKSGVSYTVFLYGRSRPGDTWQGWLVFERSNAGKRFATDVETTQPNSDAILYWSTGLTPAYFEGALERALRAPQADRPAAAAPASLGDRRRSAMRRRRLGNLERAVLSAFQAHHTARLRTDILLNELEVVVVVARDGARGERRLVGQVARGELRDRRTSDRDVRGEDRRREVAECPRREERPQNAHGVAARDHVQRGEVGGRSEDLG